jgi:hypothetical protein
MNNYPKNVDSPRENKKRKFSAFAFTADDFHNSRMQFESTHLSHPFELLGPFIVDGCIQHTDTPSSIHPLHSPSLFCTSLPLKPLSGVNVSLPKTNSTEPESRLPIHMSPLLLPTSAHQESLSDNKIYSTGKFSLLSDSLKQTTNNCTSARTFLSTDVEPINNSSILPSCTMTITQQPIGERTLPPSLGNNMVMRPTFHDSGFVPVAVGVNRLDHNSTTPVHPSHIHRQFNCYPDSFFDISRKYLSATSDKSIIKLNNGGEIIGGSMQKFYDVQNGKKPFGRPVILPSFQPPADLKFEIPATFPVLLILHTFCREQVLLTRKGQVVIWPLTVFTNNLMQNGYPVLMIHRAQFNVVLARLYSASKKCIKSTTYREHFGSVECKFNPLQDDVLVTLTGLEPFNHNYQKKDNGFFMIPAHWFRVMKSFFLDDHSLRNLGDLFQYVFTDWVYHFQPEFRVIWLGDEREISVLDFLKTCDQEHTLAMTRARAADGYIRIGKNGKLWLLPIHGSKKNSMATYDEHSLVFGASCWDTSLKWLNTAVDFFCDISPLRSGPIHMSGLFLFDTDTAILNRSESLRQGLCNDRSKKHVSNHVRSQRYKLGVKYGKDFVVNFFGVVRTCVKKKPV